MPDDDRDECCGKGKDLVSVGPPIEDKPYHPFVRHRPDCSIQTGFLRRIRDGESIINGGLQLGSDRGDGTYEVLAEIPSMASRAEQSGPAQVATDEYRTGWDNIFGNKTVGQA